MIYYVLLCVAIFCNLLPWFAMCCYLLLSFAMFCTIFCYVLLCCVLYFAMFCYVLLCFAIFCYALLDFTYVWVYLDSVWSATVAACELFGKSSMNGCWSKIPCSGEQLGGIPTPLKKISQWGWLFSIYGKIKLYIWLV